MDLTDEQWKVIKPLIPDPPRRADGRGRPWRDAREVLNGILWILRTERPGMICRSDIRPTRPAIGASSSGCVQGCLRSSLGRWLKTCGREVAWILRSVSSTAVSWPLKRGGDVWERPSGAKARSSWQWQTALVFLSPHASPVLTRPQRLIGDRAYDSDPLVLLCQLAE